MASSSRIEILETDLDHRGAPTGLEDQGRAGSSVGPVDGQEQLPAAWRSRIVSVPWLTAAVEATSPGRP